MLPNLAAASPEESAGCTGESDAVDRSIMLALFLIAFALRFYGYNSEGYWSDEIITLRVIELPFGHIFAERMGRGHLPLYFYLLKLWALIGGHNRFWLLLPNFVAGSLAAVVCYAVARTAGALRSGALLAGLLAACSPLQIMHAQELRMYPLALLAGGLSLLIFLSAGKGRSGFFLSLVVFLFFALTHATAIILLAAMLAVNLIGIIKKRQVSFGNTAALIVASTLQGSLLLYATQLSVIRDRIELGAIKLDEPLNNLLFLLAPGYPSPAPGTAPIFVAAGLLTCGLALRGLGGEKSPAERTFKLTLAVMLVFTAILSLRLNLLSSSRYLIYFQIFFFSLAGLGLSKLKTKQLRLPLILLLALASLAVAHQRIAHIAKPQWREAASAIAAEYRTGEKIWFFSLSDDNPFRYYLPHNLTLEQNPAIQLLLKSSNAYATDREFSKLAASMRNAAGVWLVRDEQLMTVSKTHASAIVNDDPSRPVNPMNVLPRVKPLERRLRSTLDQSFPAAVTEAYEYVTIFHYSRKVTGP